MHGAPTSLEEMLRRYLRRHRRCADTPAGIARWWLADLADPPPPDALQTALDALVEEGWLERRRHADGVVIYAATGSEPQTDEGEHP